MTALVFRFLADLPWCIIAAALVWKLNRECAESEREENRK